MTFCIMSVGIMSLSIMKFTVPFIIMTLGIMAFRETTLSILKFSVTFSISDSRHY